MDIFALIEEHRAQLSSSEQMIVDILTSDFDFAVNASIVDLATRAGVSAPTVTRFCRRLGCHNFSDFKVRLARSAYAGMPGPAKGQGKDVTATSDDEVVAQVINSAREALFQLHRDLDTELLSGIAEELLQAEMVWCLGSVPAVGALHEALVSQGKRTAIGNEPGLQMAMAHRAAPGDVFIAISPAGDDRELARVLDLARGADAITIALAAPDGHLAIAADLFLPLASAKWAGKGASHHILPVLAEVIIGLMHHHKARSN